MKGILASAVAFLLFTGFDTVSKYLSHRYSIFQVMGVEFTSATMLLVAYATSTRKGASMRETFRVRRADLHGLRASFQISGQTLTFLAIPHLTLTELYVIVFCMPAMTVLMAGWFLKERATASVWAVLAVSFTGMLVALRPHEVLNAWAFVALAGIFCLAAALVVLRKMTATESVEVTAITTGAALALSSLAVTPFVYESPGFRDLGLMFLGGAFFAPAQIMLATAFRLVPAALATPPQFLQLVYGAVAGYLVFGDVPTSWIYFGGAIVIAANAFLLYVQTGQNRPAPPLTPLPLTSSRP